jgi:hypothetical protein
VEKRWKRLDAFRKDHGVLPKWIPREMTKEELIAVLAGNQKLGGAEPVRKHSDEYVLEIIDMDQ